MSRPIQKTALLAWFLWILAIVCETASIVLRIHIDTLLLRNVQGPEYLQEQLYWVVLVPALVPAYATVGAIVATRRPGNGVGWLCLSFGLFISIQDFTSNYAALALEIAPGSLPAGQLVAWLENVLTLGHWTPLSQSPSLPSPPLLLTLMLLIFPNGRFLSRRWRFVAWVAVACACVSIFLSIVSPTLNVRPNTKIANPTGVSNIGFAVDTINILLLGVEVIVFLAAITSIVLRWNRAKGKERLQLKWLMYMGVMSGAAALLSLISSFVPVSPYIPLLLGAVSLAGGTIGIPVAIGIAMLRHRLYDIDLIIHRTLVYSTLTVSLAAVYEVSIFTLQSLTGGLGLIRGNQLAIIASTFLIGALFKPVHDRTQKLIDRRFYRRKYDAAKTLATFNTTIRDEVDLNQLCTKLMAVVEETMQPARVSVWLCPHKRYIE
jgi:hypothetical protein